MTVYGRRNQEAKPIGSIRAAPSAVRKAQQSKSYNYLIGEIQGLKRANAKIKPETKVYQETKVATTTSGTISAVNLLSQITQGLANDNRVGSTIRVKRIEITCMAPTDALTADQSFFLIRPHDKDNPVIGDFSGGKIPLYDTTSGWEIWRHHDAITDKQLGGADIHKVFRHGGMKVTFEAGSANPTKNALYWVHYNNVGTSISYQLAYRVWFTDA